MKRGFRMLMAALCSVVFLCGFSVTAYAGGGDEVMDYETEPVVETEPATEPEPVPTIEPGAGFAEEGNLVTRDLLYDKNTNKQFISVQTSGGNTFYIVIDYDKPTDEDGEQYETYFFSIVDEADLLAAMMKKPSHIQTPPPSKAPKGSRCHGCPYWRGIACVSCYRELLGKPGGR